MLIFSFTHGASLFIPRRQKRRRRRTRTSDKVTNQVTGDSGFTLSIVIICSTNNNAMLPLSPEVGTSDIPLSDIIADMMEEEETTKAQSGQRKD